MELGVPEAEASGDQLSSETLTQAADPVYLHPVQTSKMRNTARSVCLSTSTFLYVSVSLFSASLANWMENETEC